MTANQKAYHAAYNKQWREANKDKIKAYLEANKDKIKAQRKVYYDKIKDDPEFLRKDRERNKRYYKKNREEIRAKQKKYNDKPESKKRKAATDKAYRDKLKDDPEFQRKKIEYRKKNAERERARANAWFAKNKFTYCQSKEFKAAAAARTSKRRSIGRKATLPTTDLKLIEKLYKKCAKISKEKNQLYHVDHIIPLSIGGAHHQDNLRVVISTENQQKSARYIPELGGVWANNNLARKTKKKLGIK